MIVIYTNLNKLSVIFARLSDIAKQHKIDLRYGLVEKTDNIFTRQVITKIGQDIHISNIQSNVIVFWFAKSNNSHLVYYRVCESLESIYNGLQLLENHKELIK